MPELEFNKETTIQEIADAYPDKLKGRTILVTGSTSGLGLGFSKYLAKYGAGMIIITGRTSEKLAKAKAEIESANPGNTTVIESIIIDFADVEAVKRAASNVEKLNLKIDCLVNNAGIALVPTFETINGYESQFFVNHLGPFLFTNLIIGCLSHGARIINISSNAHRRRGVVFEDINFDEGRAYDKWFAYAQSKSANILFAKSLTSKYFKEKGIESFSVHPGAIMVTNIATHVDPVEEGWKDKDGNWTERFAPHVVTMEQGLATYLLPVLSPEISGKGGAFFMHCQIREPLVPLTDEDAEKLWKLSNNILGTKFGLNSN